MADHLTVEGDPTDPSDAPMPDLTKRCPACGARLVIRRNRATEGEFLGCSAWPDCRHTEAVPESLRMRRLGAPTLF